MSINSVTGQTTDKDVSKSNYEAAQKKLQDAITVSKSFSIHKARINDKDYDKKLGEDSGKLDTQLKAANYELNKTKAAVESPVKESFKTFG